MTSLLVGSLSLTAFAQPKQAPTGRDGESTPLPPTPPEEPQPGEPPPPAEEPPFEEPAPPPEIVVRGSERLVWDQPVAAYEALAGLTFRIYVDGGPRLLDGVSCARTVGPSGVECQAPLPRVSPGVHTLWMSAVISAPEHYEGPYSWPIVVRLVDGDGGAAGMSVRPAPPGPSPWPLPRPVLTTGLDDPTDLAALPDGSLLIAERAGQIRWFREGEGLRTVEMGVPDLVTGDGRGLLSLAVDRDFSTTRAVFALYTTDTGLRAARFVFADGVLGQRAIVVDSLPAAAVRPQARIRMGPDRTLYIALDDGGAVDRAVDLGSLSGKVLRINQDGMTPADLPAGAPVHLSGVQGPTGLVWLGRPQTLWVTDNVEGAPPQLLRGPADTAWPRAALARFEFPAELGTTTAAAAVTPARLELGESLLVAGSGGRTGLLRIAFGPGGDVLATAWIATDGIEGTIVALAVAGDGAVYACTARAMWRLDATGG